MRAIMDDTARAYIDDTEPAGRMQRGRPA
jgi:hypothetical protein